ncbi:MAG: type II CAAX prenyl endopeptidase Rce1 family protein [Halobacteriales archaeon]
MVRPAVVLATTGVVLVLAIGLAVVTARAVRPMLPPRGHAGPIVPVETVGTSTRALYANAAATQLLLGVALAVGLWVGGLRPSDLGLGGDVVRAGAVGFGLGLALAAANAGLQAGLGRVGVPYDDRLRRLLAPRTHGDWVALFAVVLPTVAAFEELLFRGALIGAVAVALGISPWWLVPLSAVTFALGHGLQGAVGLLAAGALGAVLATGFVVTGDLLVVVVAHYVVNAVEFGVAR